MGSNFQRRYSDGDWLAARQEPNPHRQWLVVRKWRRDVVLEGRECSVDFLKQGERSGQSPKIKVKSVPSTLIQRNTDINLLEWRKASWISGVMTISILGPQTSSTGKTLPRHHRHRRKFKGHAVSPSPSTNPEVEKATEKFSQKKVLGEGGFGRVYHGIIQDGTEVAVKLLTRDNQNGDREFIDLKALSAFTNESSQQFALGESFWNQNNREKR